MNDPAAPLAPDGTARASRFSITARTAGLAWLVAIATLLIFALSILPEQKRTFIDNLRSKAHGVAVSLRDVAAGAVVNEDYSSVVDHCTEMLKGDRAIDYIVLTRNDGFSLVHDRTGWRTAALSGSWRPERREVSGRIDLVPLFQRRVFQYSQPFDYSGIEWGWIHIGLSLESYDLSVARVYRRTLWLCLVSILLGLAASIFYAKHLVRPILQLQSVVRRVAGGDLSVRAGVNRTDELGQLAASVNTMTDALLRRDRTLKEANETLELRVAERTHQLEQQIAEKEKAHRELAEAQHRLMGLSREAGMAEVATGVLHNVGNVLNSVNVSATLVQDQLAGSQLDSLLQAARLLEQHREDFADFILRDTRGRHLPDFIIAIAGALATEHATWREELGGLAKNIGHIKEIVAMQQSYARVAGVIERLSPRELVEDALRINEAAYARHGISLCRDYQPSPDVSVDKHKVLQILINLFGNAKYAVDHLPVGSRLIKVSIAPTAEGRVRIAIADNGIGIPPENLARIFSLGFTTRKNGHGFGLHTGALAAREIGGSLVAHSDGPGRGARFVLELPATIS
ncbi:MAG TPA: ATP-binding protein, partial [Opitutus sp.]|nr:ATP-binding protein [Opitutus sp.]